MGFRPWAGLEGGLPSTEALDPPDPSSCQAFFRACRYLQGPDASCLGLLQAFMFPVAPQVFQLVTPDLLWSFPRCVLWKGLVVK